MSLDTIIPIQEVREKIGEERARAVERFMNLVDKRNYREARNIFEAADETTRQDFRIYAEVYLKELSFCG